MSTKGKEVSQEIPATVVDPTTKKRYTKGKFLGKGGFAKCYELIDMETKDVYAGKIVSKSSLTKEHQKEKMKQEIEIHRGLEHKHIVGFHGYFEDSSNVYIILELCRKRSLMEMHKRRKYLSEREARYFLHQIASGCKYLHSKRIIHRDLKLGNLFIGEEMVIKVGDFGLATQLDYDGERKRTLCGTPNYIAPEVLGKKGHSYEVDAWSLGCILYVWLDTNLSFRVAYTRRCHQSSKRRRTSRSCSDVSFFCRGKVSRKRRYTLLAGKPPFETSNLQDTYKRIRKNEYQIPSKVPPLARDLIQKLLHPDPSHRPTMDQVIKDPFLTSGSAIPARLPTSCLTTAPRADETLTTAPPSSATGSRKPLVELNKAGSGSAKKVISVPVTETKPATDKGFSQPSGEPEDGHLSELLSLLSSVVASQPSAKTVIHEDDALDPAAAPVFWVAKWVDYSDKYGLGYQLSDNSCGVIFNDSTRIIELSDGRNIHYIERDMTEHYHTVDSYPVSLKKKITLLNYFKNYMNDHLLRAGGDMAPREGDEFSRIPYLKAWFRTRTAIILQLTNGTLQINFFQDHTKIIVCPLMGAVTYIGENREVNTYRLKRVEKYGCSKDLGSRLRYAKTMVERLITTKSCRGRTTKEN